MIDMKEDYFGEGRLIQQAWEFLDCVYHLRVQRKRQLDTRTSALLVMDMQDYFLEEVSHSHIPSANAIVPQIERLQQAFFRKHLPVIQTRHINDTRNAGQMAQWWQELITINNPLSRITPQLSHQDAFVITKSQYDAFYNTPLEEKLKNSGVTQVVITGVIAHLCCETTARSAFVRGFEVFFVIDATATHNRQFHQSTLINLAQGFATPVLTQEILDSVK
jgi:isochorismate hydrolase